MISSHMCFRLLLIPALVISLLIGACGETVPPPVPTPTSSPEPIPAPEPGQDEETSVIPDPYPAPTPTPPPSPQEKPEEQLSTLEGDKSIPGDTRADLQLQTDVLAFISIFNKVKAPNCAEPIVINSEITEASNNEGSWAERWTFDLCGEEVAYDINYWQDGKGGVYFKVGLAETP